MRIDSEARKAATVKLARELYELMPGTDPILAQGEYHWPMIEVTKAYSFCMLIAARIVAWKCRADPQAIEPTDCNWPYCGCDPHADRVMEGLIEHGWRSPDECEGVSKLEAAVHAWVEKQSSTNTTALYNAAVRHFGLTPVIPD